MALLFTIYTFLGFLVGSLLLSIASDDNAIWGGHRANFVERTAFFFLLLFFCPVTITVISFYLLSDYISKRENPEDTKEEHPVLLPL
jgi:hypothetical protein